METPSNPLLKITDLAAVARFIPTGLQQSSEHPFQLDALGGLGSLLPNGRAKGVMIVRTERDARGTIGAGAAAFVTDEYVRRCKTEGRPGLAERVIRAAIGPGSCVLAPAGIELQNKYDMRAASSYPVTGCDVPASRAGSNSIR